MLGRSKEKEPHWDKLPSWIGKLWYNTTTWSSIVLPNIMSLTYNFVKFGQRMLNVEKFNSEKTKLWWYSILNFFSSRWRRPKQTKEEAHHYRHSKTNDCFKSTSQSKTLDLLHELTGEKTIWKGTESDAFRNLKKKKKKRGKNKMQITM